MTLIYPDLEWNSSVSERKSLPGRCPHAAVRMCPRYFESVSILSDVGIASRMPTALHDEILAKWEKHDLWPATAETATSISGGKTPNCFSNFCPEVSFDTFKLFASNIIFFYDELDRSHRERALTREGVSVGRDWRWNWEHVSPLHYSDCPHYSKLEKRNFMPQKITIHGNVHGQVNVAGESINSPSLNISLSEILTKIDSSSASTEEKAAAKSKLVEFLAHPVVAAIIGGLAGKIGT